MHCIVDQDAESGESTLQHTTQINYLACLSNDEIYSLLWEHYALQGNLVDESGDEGRMYLDQNGKVVMCLTHYALMCAQDGDSFSVMRIKEVMDRVDVLLNAPDA